MIASRFFDEDTGDEIKIQTIGEEVRILINGAMSTAWYNICNTELFRDVQDIDKVYDLLLEQRN